MKMKTLIAFWLLVITFGAAIAAEKKVDHSEKYQIDTFKFGDMIDITVLSKNWIAKTWPKVEKRWPNRLVRGGTMSNGVSFYRKVTEHG